MIEHLLRRFGVALLLVFAVSSGSVILTRLAPGDYVVGTLGVGSRPEAVARERTRLGLDRPLLEQYGHWLGRAVRFDFGRSLAYDRPVADLVPERAFNTLVLAVSALLLATLVGLPFGVITGTRRPGLLTACIKGVSLVLVSMPPLLTSLLLVFAAARTGWLPIGGMRSLTDSGLIDRLRHLVVPVLALGLPIGAMFERMQAQAMRDAVSQPFVVATLARGVSRRRLVWRNALKVGLRPMAAVYGLVIGSLLSGSFAVEVITAWPGLGRLMLDAIRTRDVYLVAGCAAAGSIFLAVGTLLSDIALVVVDPRRTE